MKNEDDPYWEPVNQWQVAGKKAYFENNQVCFDYQTAMNNYCSTCMSVCPWSKQDTTLLHDAARIAGSQMPFLSKYIVYMDDLFGYGLIEIKKEWKSGGQKRRRLAASIRVRAGNHEQTFQAS